MKTHSKKMKRRQLARGKLTKAILPLLTIPLSSALYAEDGDKFVLDINEQSASVALMKLAETSGAQIIFSPEIGRNTLISGLSGEYTLGSALEKMLEGSGLSYEFLADDSVIITQRGGSAQNKKFDAKNTRELEELIVTAQKREQSVMDVPISIMAFGAQELDKGMIGDLDDLEMFVPGLSVAARGDVQRRIFMRGMSNLAGGTPHVGLYLDEMPVTAGGSSQPDIRTYDLERVEVLKGPQGTLYGQGSMAGTIRFITRNPQLDRFGFSGNMSASFTKDGDPGQKIQGMINLPVVENVFGLRISGVVENEGGWVDQPATGAENINSRNLADIRVKALWAPTEAVQVNGMVVVHEADSTVGLREDENGNLLQYFRETVPGVLDAPAAVDEYKLYNLTVDWDLDAVNLISATSYFDSNRDIKDLTWEDTEDFFLGWSFESEATIFTQEFRLSSSGEGAWQWLVGGFYRDFDTSSLSDGYYAIGSPTATPAFFGSGIPTVVSSESWAVFGETSLELWDSLEVGVGVRYFKDDQEQFTTSQSATFDSVTPRVYVNYNVTDEIMIYASVAKGFRSGGFNPPSTGFPPYDPEEVLSNEIGAKMTLADGRLDLEVALFSSEYTDYVVIGVPPGSVFSTTSNAGDVDIKGVEWALRWQMTDTIGFAFNGNRVDTEVVEVRASATSHFVGDPIDYIPEYQYTFSLNKDFDWNGRPGYARLDYQRRAPSIFRNRQYALFGESDVINRMNFHIGWDWSESLSFGLFAQNVLNDRDRLEPDAIFSRSRPRTIGVEFGVSFE